MTTIIAYCAICPFIVTLSSLLGFGVFLVIQDAWAQWIDPIIFRGRK